MSHVIWDVNRNVIRAREVLFFDSSASYTLILPEYCCRDLNFSREIDLLGIKKVFLPPSDQSCTLTLPSSKRLHQRMAKSSY